MSNICPYPGLRPFNEEESIFFRGREEHIEKIISQLEEKKFVMLTGASGDGKSSIVYAGVIPNARAGFFKAKFNNWLIADFRPERSPLKNMAIALAERLGYSDVDYVEKELGFGFSSLINLYKKSPFYLDNNSELWKNADDVDRKKLKRKAANLFILVDQFEEFFTNAENYHNGKASVNSQTVINLLLETAKIALAEDLPIYIICTMRSDYIGQCAAFRGLPEYIGFSQFFVPRLKRKEIHQVIEEPATLSGNTISNRLIETLINELGEGFDQLPVLQHALNQIWNQADKGSEEMDLIHLAKLTGLPEKNLPANDKEKFTNWFSSVPAFKKIFFKNPSLENVLNSHANELYQTACDYYNKTDDEKITRDEACLIIKATFQCLTKIDDARAVRNRMTLEEITNIINSEEINLEKVSGVLEIFRLQGNTFLKPFVTTDELSKHLKPNDVLDITHESLIRNWDLLDEWAKEEFENYQTFQDFNKQLQRWINSNKAAGYLLPIGPLTFFENWFNTCKPNKHWLARYDESEDSKEEKLIKAEKTLNQANLFIKLSARRLFFSRIVLKYGANKLITYVGIIALFISCTFYYFDYRQKQNNAVLSDIKQRGLDMLSSKKITNEIKADFVIKHERLEPNSFTDVLNDLDNDTLAFDIAFEMFGKVQNFETKVEDKEETNPLIYPLLSFLNERLDNIYNRERINFCKNHKINVLRINKFLSLCAFVKSYDDSQKVNELIEKNTWKLNRTLTEVLDLSVDSASINVEQFGHSIQLLLAIAPQTDFNYYIEKLSPWNNNEEAKKRFENFYPEDKIDNNAYIGYQLLAYLYSTQKDSLDINKLESCISMANRGKREIDNRQINYFTFYDIVNTLSKYNNYSLRTIKTLFDEYSKSSSMNMLPIMDKTISDNFNIHIPYQKVKDDYFQYYYFVKYFRSDKQRDNVWNIYAELLKMLKEKGKTISYTSLGTEGGSIKQEENFTENDLNFYSAMYCKKRGIYSSEILNDINLSDNYFGKSFEYYNLLSKEYIDGIYKLGAFDKMPSDIKLIKKSYLFLYPKLLNEYHYFEYYTSGGYSWGYNISGVGVEHSQSTAFLDYIEKNKLTGYYKKQEDFDILKNYSYLLFNNDFKKDSLFYQAVGLMNDFFLKDSSLKKHINQNFISLLEVNVAFENGDTSKAFKLYAELDIDKIIQNGFLKNANKEDEELYIAGNHKNLLQSLAKQFAKYGKLKESFKLINIEKDPVDKRNLLIEIAYDLQKKGAIENTFYYLDSLFKNNDVDGKPKFGNKLIEVLAMVGSNETFDLSIKLIKDIPEKTKHNVLNNFIKGVAYNGFYYKALHQYIPNYVSSDKELQLYNIILQSEIENKTKKEQNNGWKKYDNAEKNIDGNYE